MKLLPFIMSLLLAVYFGCAKRTVETCLDYSFTVEYPHAFKFYNNKIIIGNGLELVAFNRSGLEIGRIVLPTVFLNGDGFLDFMPLGDTSYLVTIYGRLYQVTPNTQKLLNSNFGELLRGDSSVAITTFQESDTVNNRTINGVKIFNPATGRVFKYPTKRDLGTYNFEMLNENIALSTPDRSFCLLPIDTARETKVYDIALEDYYSFLGMNGENFVFLTRDYARKEDHLHFYDSKMKFVKEGVLDVSYDDVSDVIKADQGLAMEAPFGNFYSFDKTSRMIFVFRHTRQSSVCFFPIEDHLRVIKKP